MLPSNFISFSILSSRCHESSELYPRRFLLGAVWRGLISAICVTCEEDLSHLYSAFRLSPSLGALEHRLHCILGSAYSPSRRDLY